MNSPALHAPRPLRHAVTMLPATLPVPGAGLLPVNAAVLHAREPVLVDTGLASLREDFLAALEDTIDPADLRWIWLTHADPDHVGNLEAVLARAPQARVVTNFLGLGKLGLLGVQTDRFLLLEPGQSLDLGDRRLTALRPPVYDAPETMMAFDGTTLFSADFLGALLPHEVLELEALHEDELRPGLLAWSRIDAPWLGDVDRAAFSTALARVARLQPAQLAGSHLPAAHGGIDRLLEWLRDAPEQPEFVGPDQAAFEALLAQA